MATHEEMVDAFGSALDGSDPDAFVGALAPGAIVWHNHDRREVDARENMAAIEMLGQIVSDAEIETLKLAETPDGFVLQFVLRASVQASAKPFEMHKRSW
jgi:hypothetical protein